MLGAPRRGISMLEIGMLEGELEAGLRHPAKRESTLRAIAHRVVKALRAGLAGDRPDAIGAAKATPDAIVLDSKALGAVDR